MNLNSQQFKEFSPAPAPPIKSLPAAVSKNYQELAHFINLQIKQKRLETQTCCPWQLDYTPAQTARIMGISRSQVYNLMNSGELNSIHIGRSRRIANTHVE